MKAKEISVQIVKNLGNYESVRFSCEYILGENDDLQTALSVARNELEKAYLNAYPKEAEQEVKSEKDRLTPNHPHFDRIAKALIQGKTTISKVQESYEIDSDTYQEIINILEHIAS